MLLQAMPPTVITLADRPDLATSLDEMSGGWPPFMTQDPMGWNLATVGDLFPECQLAALDGDCVVGKAHSAPIHWSGEADDLADQGWDDALGRALRAGSGGRAATAVSALEVAILPEWRGRGLSRLMVVAMLDNAARLGFQDLVAPVRPSAKHAHPHVSMADYLRRTRDDGLPDDPWLRVHARLGGTIIKVCPASMSIAGSLAQWRTWTGLPFDRSGDVEVPGALAPVHVSVEHDHAVYVEANVWMRHRLPKRRA